MSLLHFTLLLSQVGSLEACQLLVEAGARTEARDKFNRTPAALAKEFGFVDLLKYLEHLK